MVEKWGIKGSRPLGYLDFSSSRSPSVSVKGAAVIELGIVMCRQAYEPPELGMYWDPTRSDALLDTFFEAPNSRLVIDLHRSLTRLDLATILPQLNSLR